MERTVVWVDLVEDIYSYLHGSDDPEFLIEMYELMFPDTKVVYEDDSMFTIRSEP